MGLVGWLSVALVGMVVLADLVAGSVLVASKLVAQSLFFVLDLVGLLQSWKCC